jgi:hypothetical protein
LSNKKLSWQEKTQLCIPVNKELRGTLSNP